MKRLMRNLRLILLLFIVLSFGLIGGIAWQQQKSRNLLLSGGENKLALKARYAEAGSVITADGVVLAESRDGKRYYAENPLLASSLVQLLGDYTHNIGNSLEMRYEKLLCGLERHPLRQFLYDLRGLGRQGSGLLLHLDSRLCLLAAELLDGHKGAILVMNYEDGRILALSNAPTVSPENVIQWRNIPDTALFNRALQAAYAPGSTFKIVSDLCWIESPDYDANLVWRCRGQEPLLGKGSVHEERKDAGHGDVNRQQAMALSCNHFFGHVAVQCGAEALRNSAEKMAFNKNLNLDGLAVAKSEFYMPSDDPFILSWMAIGQPIERCRLSLSPMHLALISAAVANQGEMINPRLIQAIIEPDGKPRAAERGEPLSRCFTPETAAVMAADMLASVQFGMARSAAIEGWKIGGKTGTAQVGDGYGGVVNSLFSGFILDKRAPVAVAIVVEGESIDVSAMARQIFLKIIELRTQTR